MTQCVYTVHQGKHVCLSAYSKHGDILQTIFIVLYIKGTHNKAISYVLGGNVAANTGSITSGSVKSVYIKYLLYVLIINAIARLRLLTVVEYGTVNTVLHRPYKSENNSVCVLGNECVFSLRSHL